MNQAVGSLANVVIFDSRRRVAQFLSLGRVWKRNMAPWMVELRRVVAGSVVICGVLMMRALTCSTIGVLRD